ncbi:hypothetical protein NM688_g5626 [Phlebia brevispora]|uniref:Uncharacterized protein n=1 Tax=Phlebia brevispora TaxID=194682 RepID=A0ACC1SS76_9APHY|nr:hypothetical protein NM688_g5626 [Phlebia brevispora]
MSASALESGIKFTDTRSVLNVHGVALLTLSFQTLGIIYSDIGTSPLYVLNGIWPADGPVPSKEDVLGGISAIIWALTILPLIKYVLICLHFGTTEGEGGTYALFQGLFPPAHKDFEADRTLTGDSFRKFSLDTPSAKLPQKLWWPLLVLSLFGTSLTLADGVFTPAVSVTSAVSGIAVAKESVAGDVTPISIGFLVFVFLLQSFGTSFLAYIFAPVTFIWLALLASTGIVNIVSYPGIFRAFDPSRAVMLFVRTRDYDLLAGILLCVTGCEALFANLGQFNMASIQISFTCFVYPSLILAYLGQGARLITDGENVLSNIFYQTIPGKHQGPLFWVLYVFAILATLIASQALITASFSLIQQLINMRNLPAFRMVYTSEKIQGQVYIPAVNWTLMVIIIIVVAAFKSSTALTNAYGFAVATVMLTTTLLIALQFKYVKGLPALLGIAFFLVFGFFDGLFWGAAVKKVPKGAWVPLMIGIILLSAMLFWTWAKRLEDDFDGSTRRNLRHIIVSRDEDPELQIGLDPEKHEEPNVDATSVETTVEDDGASGIQKPIQYYVLDGCDSLVDIRARPGTPHLKPLARIPTCAVFHKLTTGRGVPHAFISFIRQWPALPEVVIFLSVRVLHTARIPPADRYVVSKTRSIQGFYGVTYYLGFRDDFDVQMNEIIDRICAIEERVDPQGCAPLLKQIRCKADKNCSVPHYIVKSKKISGGKIAAVRNWFRSLLIEEIYYRLMVMFPETVNWFGSAQE